MRLVCVRCILLICTLLSFQFNVFSIESELKLKKTTIKGSVNLNDEYVVQVSELLDKQQSEDYPLTANGEFQVDLELSEPTWVEVSFVPAKKDRQLGATFPLYLKPGDKLNLELTYDKQTYLQLLPKSSKSENRALIEYATFSNLTTRDLFHKRNNPDEYKNAVESYLSEAQVLAKEYKVKNKAIAEYLTLWSYNNYLAVATTSRQLTIPEERLKIIPSLFDTESTLTFWNGVSNVNNFVNPLLKYEGDPILRISNKIDKLNELFKTDVLITSVIKNDLEKYVTSYKITNPESFQSDIKQLETLLNRIDDEQLKSKILQDFKNLHNTSVGSDVPAVKFKDLAGNAVSLEQFKGKYVYIDLWASWCVPCIKEIPFLHELEKEFKDKNIAFVSISLDNNKDAWRNKVAELKLEGYQWELGDSNYDKLMNVTGIPHFILYSPEGKLLRYKAPRPSSKEISELFRSFN